MGFLHACCCSAILEDLSEYSEKTFEPVQIAFVRIDMSTRRATAAVVIVDRRVVGRVSEVDHPSIDAIGRGRPIVNNQETSTVKTVGRQSRDGCVQCLQSLDDGRQNIESLRVTILQVFNQRDMEFVHR